MTSPIMKTCSCINAYLYLLPLEGMDLTRAALTRPTSSKVCGASVSL